MGKLVESGASEDIFTRPLHPYTQALFSAALPSHPDARREEIVLQGEVPSPMNIPRGCRFNPRCFKAQSICCEVEPNLVETTSQHFVSCHFPG